MQVLIRPLLCLIVSFWLTTAQADVTVYTAALIRTMEPALPEATAVAVQDGRIVAVGSLKDMEPVLRIRGGKIDRRFENQVIVPGFIDPHVHPSLPAILTQFPFLAHDDWSLPTGEFPGQRHPRLTKIASRLWQRNTETPKHLLLPGAIILFGTARFGAMS